MDIGRISKSGEVKDWEGNGQRGRGRKTRRNENASEYDIKFIHNTPSVNNVRATQVLFK